MLKKLLLLALLAAGAGNLQAQALPNRYRAEITSQLTTTTNVAFSTNIPQVKTINLAGYLVANEETYGDQRVTLRMDIYQPQGDTLSKRPAIIFCFGGGFVNGSRTSRDMVLLAQAFARRGYVTATIDYRLGMNLTDPEKAKRAVYRALQDGRSAVRFFRNTAAAYRIDPEQIYLSGHSAGAFIACNNAYLDREAERPASTFSYNGLADLGTLDAIGDNQRNAQGQLVSGKANAVLSFAGAVSDLVHVAGAQDVPVSLFHSYNDPIVSYNTAKPFSFLDFLPGVNLPVVYGSGPINSRANAVNAPHELNAYSLRGHNVHFNQFTQSLYSDIVPKGSDFLYNYRLKPAAAAIAGARDVCTTATSQVYSLGAGFGYCDWQVSGGTIVSRNAATNSVTVAWSSAATTRRLTATPYSRQLAQGSPVSLTVSLTNCLTALALAPASGTDLVAFSAYPNPTTGRLQVQLPATTTGTTSLRVLNKFGIEQSRLDFPATHTAQASALDLSQLPAGVYYVQLTDATGTKVQRVVKE